MTSENEDKECIYPLTSPVEIVEKWDEVEAQFDPAFLLCSVEFISIHDGGGVIETRTTHHRAMHVPVPTCFLPLHFTHYVITSHFTYYLITLQLSGYTLHLPGYITTDPECIIYALTWHTPDFITPDTLPDTLQWWLHLPLETWPDCFNCYTFHLKHCLSMLHFPLDTLPDKFHFSLWDITLLTTHCLVNSTFHFEIYI